MFMPLIHSGSKEARQENIHREIEAGKPIKQAVAIGYSVQREAMKGHDHEQAKAEREDHELRKYGR
jgi:hypothetical protein